MTQRSVENDPASYGFNVADLWQTHLEISNVFFTTHAYLSADNDDPKIVAFRRAYTRAYTDAVPDAFAALGYDAARLVITAIRHAGSTGIFQLPFSDK